MELLFKPYKRPAIKEEKRLPKINVTYDYTVLRPTIFLNY